MNKHSANNQVNAGQTRRSFLKTFGGAVAGAAVVGLAGCSGQPSSASSESGTTGGTDNISWDGEYDVIVVGAGAAGLASALTVPMENPEATCLILEKEARPGGNSPFCAGNFLYTDNPEEMTEYLNNLIGGATPDALIDSYVTGLTEEIEWLKATGASESDLGVLFPPDSGEYFGEYPEFPSGGSCGVANYSGHDGGPTHIHSYLLDCVENGPDTLTYMPSTPMDDLIQDKATGEIIGVSALGKNYKARAGVIMCTGGYEANPDMIADYMGVTGCKALATSANTGDGHRAVMKVGADLWHMYGGACFWMACRDLDNKQFLSSIWNFDNKGHGITVGVNGRRFYMDWDGCYITPSATDENFANAQQPIEKLSVEVGYRHGITQFGGNWTHLTLPEKGWYIFDSVGLTNGAIPAETTTDPVADNWAISANSIEELAEKIEVPVDELTRTVATWNSFCDAGEDPAFYRPASSLERISEPPFYAMLCAPTVLNTDGGPRRNEKAEVLDPFGDPIPHLYAAGEFGSIWGHLYQGAGNIAECLIYGKIASKNALSNL